MQQAYGKTFAQVYNKKWTSFAIHIAPLIKTLLESRKDFSQLPKTIVDICCGTGQLARYFLATGFSVYGIDLSPYMLEIAQNNNQSSVASGTATFKLLDASKFTLPTCVSYATCLFDSVNHFDSMESVRSCFRCTYDSLILNGLFVFDINTRKGLHRWNGLSVQEDEEVFILNRGVFCNNMDRAYTQITGFLQDSLGKYDRFCETAYNQVLSVEELLAALEEIGFRDSYCASSDDLRTAISDPEALGRVYIVSSK